MLMKKKKPDKCDQNTHYDLHDAMKKITELQRNDCKQKKDIFLGSKRIENRRLLITLESTYRLLKICGEMR